MQPRGAEDHIRQHQARQDVHTERDRLLKRANKRIDVQRFLPSDGKDRARAILITSGLVSFGMIGYVVMILMWFFIYHSSLADTALAFIFLVVASVLCCALSSKKAMGKDRPWLWWVGVLNGQSTLVAVVIGFFLYFRFLCYYWKYTEMRTYTNVAAAQDASAFSDGSMILFTEDTRLDPMRSIGFKSRWTGSQYCVAPIVDGTMGDGDGIYYWAIGMDCCTGRAEFRCDDAADFATRSALVALEPTDVVRPFMAWAVRGAAYPHYLEAVRMQEATYNTKAAPDPTFVYWTRDPIAMKDTFYSTAKTLAIKLTVVYTLLLIGFTYWISWRLIPKQRREGVIRNTST